MVGVAWRMHSSIAASMTLIDEAMLPSELGALLRRERIARKLSQLAVARHVGISRKHVAAIERGATRASRATLIAIVHALAGTQDLRDRVLVRGGYSVAAAPSPASATDHLRTWLDHQRAQPMLAIDVDGRLLDANRAGHALLQALFGAGFESFTAAETWATFHRRIVDFDRFATRMMARATRALALQRGEAPSARAITERLAPRVAAADPVDDDDPWLRLRLRLDDGELDVLVVFTTAGAPPLAPIDSPRVLVVLPMDTATTARFAAFAAELPSPAAAGER